MWKHIYPKESWKKADSRHKERLFEGMFSPRFQVTFTEWWVTLCRESRGMCQTYQWFMSGIRASLIGACLHELWEQLIEVSHSRSAFSGCRSAYDSIKIRVKTSYIFSPPALNEPYFNPTYFYLHVMSSSCYKSFLVYTCFVFNSVAHKQTIAHILPFFLQ